MAYYSSQIIQTLSQQIQSLTPLRQSFRILQNYYLQITTELENLIMSTNRSQNELTCQFKYLLEVRNQLQTEFVESGQQLKYLESKYAKCEMEKSQNIVQNEALKSRKELEEQQRKNLESRGRDLIEQNKKLEFTVCKLKQMIHEVELVVKSKNYEKLDIQREIKKMQLVNSKINQLNKDAEQSITERQNQNEKTVELMAELDSKLDTYQKIIEAKCKQNKENAQTLIAKTQECEQLRNRKEYLQKLIQTQLTQQRELSKAYGQLDTILTVKRQKLDIVREQNRQYQLIIQEQKDKKVQGSEQHLRLKRYLQTLIQTNEVLFKQLERSCSQDKQVQILLTQKLQKLLVVNDKITENDLQNRRRVCFNQNAPSFAFERKSPLSKYSINLQAFRSRKLNLQDKIDEQRRNTAVDRQMRSTWGSWTKENRLYDL